MRPPKRRRVQAAAPPDVGQCFYGCKEPDQAVVSVPIYVEPIKFWLYISRIRPDVTKESVLEMVKANLNLTEDPDIFKLVPKGRDESTLTFISFKIGLDPAFKATALDRSTWPEGIMFREFLDYGSQKFPRPLPTSIIPGTVIPSITTQSISAPTATPTTSNPF